MRAANLAAAFEEILGWPYISPGTNDQSGIDCSGAFVRAFRLHGLGIAHGSNTIFRKHCDVTGRIEGDASRLHAGMAVFKQRMDGGEPAKYQGDGLGNMYHIGLVTSAKPLRIVHATTPVAKADTGLGKGDGAWTWYGWLTDVDYAGSAQAEPVGDAAGEMGGAEPMQESYAPANVKDYVKLAAANGLPVRIREKPDASLWKYEAPAGTILQKTGTKLIKGKTYAKVLYQGKERLVDSNFVVPCDARGNGGGG